MKTFLLVVLFGLVVTVLSFEHYRELACDDWKAFKDETCIKSYPIFGFQPFANASALCSSDETLSLLRISSPEEQTFVSQYLNDSQLVDDVWLGAQFDGRVYRWTSDGSELTYGNWQMANGSGRSSTAGASGVAMCVQMSPTSGKWTNVPCSKRNAVVCQKMQRWEWTELQRTVMDSRRQGKEGRQKSAQLLETLLAAQETNISTQRHLLNLQNFVGLIQMQMKNLTAELALVKEKGTGAGVRAVGAASDGLPPLGFIYVQLPQEASPADIWPSATWSNISPAYAGVFFRVTGGEASPFGTVQTEDSPRISQIRYMKGKSNSEIFPGKNSCSSVKTAGFLGDWTSLTFCMSNGEVRPLNMAVQIWKRVG